MNNPILHINRPAWLRARPSVIASITALLAVAPLQALVAQPAPDLSSFAVLGGPSVTLTGSTVNGNVGSLGAFTNIGSTVNGTVYQGVSAQPAYNDFLGVYAALELVTCDVYLTGLSLAAESPVTPGVYCFETALTETGTTLTLDAEGDPNAEWIFKIGTAGTGALTGTSFNVVFDDGIGDPCNVYWWVAEAATMTTSNFMGTIFAGTAITVTDGTFDGNALAKAAVTLTNVTAGCTPWNVPVPPVQPPQTGTIKVTGGGQIAVSNGEATFGFNAQVGKKGDAKGRLNYVNHANGLHINGKVNNILVTDVHSEDGSAKTVLFSGTFKGGTFVVTVQDNGEPGTDDEFGIWISTDASEIFEMTSMGVISRGNIQFHSK